MRNDILATAGLDSSAFDKGIDKIVKSGSKAVTALASLSNPIIAIGTALATTALEYGLQLKEIEQREERLAELAKKRLAITKEITGQAIQDAKIAQRNQDELSFGKDEAERLKREREFLLKVRDIRNVRGEGSAEEEEARSAFETNERIIAKNKRDAQNEEIAALNEQIAQLKEKSSLEGKIYMLKKEQAEIEDQIRRTPTKDLEIKRLKIAVKVAETEKQLDEEKTKRREEAAKKEEQAAKKRQKDLLDGFRDFVKANTDAVDNTIRKAKDAADERKRLEKEVADKQKEVNDAVGANFDDKVDRAMMTVGERQAADRETRKRNRAANRVNLQDQIRAKNRARGAYGQRSINTTSDAQFQDAKKSFVNRNAPKITAANIEAATIIVQQIRPK